MFLSCLNQVGNCRCGEPRGPHVIVLQLFSTPSRISFGTATNKAHRLSSLGVAAFLSRVFLRLSQYICVDK